MKINIKGLGSIEASADVLNTLGIACSETKEFFKQKRAVCFK